MKTFNFNNDVFNPTAIARIHKSDSPTADQPFFIVVTYKYHDNAVIYDYKDEATRNRDFTELGAKWHRALLD